MSYFDTVAGQNTMEHISISLQRIADALEKIAQQSNQETTDKSRFPVL